MNACEYHNGAIVVYGNDTICPLCELQDQIGDFEDKKELLEKEIRDLNIELESLRQELESTKDTNTKLQQICNELREEVIMLSI